MVLGLASTSLVNMDGLSLFFFPVYRELLGYIKAQRENETACGDFYGLLLVPWGRIY